MIIIFQNILSFIQSIIKNQTFYYGIFFTIAIFSRYIFGDDNLFEELVELWNYFITGEDIDISPNSLEDHNSKKEQFIQELKLLRHR